MKRPYKMVPDASRTPVSDIRKDVSQQQLASIGAIMLAYNYAENTINRMIGVALRLPADLYRDVVSRINGVDGKIAIVKSAAQHLGVPEDIRSFLAETLGEGAFGLLKTYRDAVTHARFVDQAMGIGEYIESRGRHVEVLTLSGLS
jgi:hypothetical protein